MKKILLLLDILHSPAPVLSSVINIANATGALVEVIFLHRVHFLVDLVYPLGTDLPSLQADEEADKRLLNDNTQLISDTFSSAKIKFLIAGSEPVSLDDLLMNSAFSDLILTDARTNISDFLYAPLNVSMKDLLSDAHCPLLLLREDGMPPDKIILAYDGSYSSIYAIKQFRYLFPHLSSLPTFLITIAANEKKGIAHGDMLKHWAPYHFQNLQVEVLSGRPAGVLPGFINHHDGTPIVVMGAYGRSSISRLFHQSLANAVLEKTSASLFTTHE
ncbi:MAG: hypothetical protein BGO55_32310 [Sphingobacteriales bacterium 50-39]|nr:universal stress protein [Sphingobacteriales bacterium]OJW61173.1 MAG: hypothetical protein BGO55_32310 [Sphingobacteriales bacterium 50-39]